MHGNDDSDEARLQRAKESVEHLEVASEIHDLHRQMHDAGVDLAKERMHRASDPSNPQEATLNAILAQLAEIQERLSQLESQQRHDSLTGVLRRDAFSDVLKREWGLHAQAQQSLAVLFFDVDNFKAINDEWDHKAGDAVLSAIGAQTLRCMRRAGELVGRYAGDEFVVLLPRSTTVDAAASAERIRRSIEAMEIPIGKHTLRVTVSIGVASVLPHTLRDEPGKLIEYADEAAIQSKRNGRNRTIAREFDSDGRGVFINVKPPSPAGQTKSKGK